MHPAPSPASPERHPAAARNPHLWRLSLILGALLSLSAPGFATDPVAPSAAVTPVNDVKLAHLYQHWIHSREEDAGPAQTYRPHDFKQFPPSRFRMQYKFQQQGACEVFFLDPADAHHFKPGQWRIDPQNPAVLHITGVGEPQTYKIQELTKDILRLAPVAQKEK